MLGYIPAMIIQGIGVIIPIIGIIVLMRKGQGKENIFLVMANFGALMMNWGYMELLRATNYQEAVSIYKFEYIGSVMFYIFFVMFLKSFFFKDRKLKGMVLCFILFFAIEGGALLGVVLDHPMAYQAINVLYREDDGKFYTNGSKGNESKENETEANESEGNEYEEILPELQTIQELSPDTEIDLSNIKGYAVVTVTHGPILKIRFGFLSLLLMATLMESIILAAKRKVREERRRMCYLIGAQAIVLASLVISFFIFGSFNMTPILVSASVMGIICGTASGNFFTVADRGRGWVLDHSDISFLIVDKDYRFLDASEYTKKMFPELRSQQFLGKLPENLSTAFLGKEDNFEHENRRYVKKMAPIEEKSKVIGYSIMLVDMTDQYNLMEELGVERQKAIDANEAKSNFMSNMSHEIRTPMNAIVGMTEIMLRRDQDAANQEYLNNIKNSGNALLAVINDILDFSKIESGKLEIIPDDYEMMSVLNDLSMIFLNRIGEKPIELFYDIDPQMPVKLRGDAGRIRQVLLNIVNNGIKYTEEGYVKLSMYTEPVEGTKIKLCCKVEDTGIGIKEEDLPKLFSTFSQVDTKKNRGKEGTGLGLSIAKQLVEAMGGSFEVESQYGKGSTFSFCMIQDMVDPTPAARIKSEKDIYVTGSMSSEEGQRLLEKLCQAYDKVHFVSLEDMQTRKAEQIHYVFVDRESACKCQMPEEMQAAVAHYQAEVIMIHNPMLESCDQTHSTVMNKPLYTLNFCLAINHEVLSFAQSQEKIMSFKAPGAKVLIVDDNEMNRKVAAGLLEPIGMQMDMASDGKQAVEKVKAERYDLVFMDHMMPIMDGIEATEAIRALPEDYYKELPIIALSANALAEAKEQFHAVGMNDFLAKPIKTKELFKMVKAYLPEDKIEESEITNETEETKEEELPEIEGLDVKAGVENSGGLKLFTSLLGDFYKLIDRKTVKIEKCLADGMIKDFTIEVHALKNTARMIGALELSDLFYELEKAGKAEDTAYIEANVQGALDLFQSYKPILKPYAELENGEKEEVSVEEIKATIDDLRQAIDTFDLDGADLAMKRLEQCKMPESIRDMVEELGALVADVAMEEVMNLCDRIVEEL